MSKISVVYWSQSGNTAAMAEAVAKGVTDAGKEAEIVFVSSASIDELKSETAFALGCPAMGAEVLEEGEMEPFVTELEGCVAGKTIGLFGSYGWGDGEWMRDWVERMRSICICLMCMPAECMEASIPALAGAQLFAQLRLFTNSRPISHNSAARHTADSLRIFSCSGCFLCHMTCEHTVQPLALIA